MSLLTPLKGVWVAPVVISKEVLNSHLLTYGILISAVYVLKIVAGECGKLRDINVPPEIACNAEGNQVNNILIYQNVEQLATTQCHNLKIP